MSFVIAAPETLVRAASDLANIGSTLGAANAAALGPTTELLAAGADEVSAAIASLFAAHGQAYQAVSAQMSAFHAQFVQTFTAGAGAYASAEAAAAAPLEGLLNIVNTPTQLLLGRPLIGNGANGAPGTGQAGGAGGLLYGNGGAGGSGAPARPAAQVEPRGYSATAGRVGPGVTARATARLAGPAGRRAAVRRRGPGPRRPVGAVTDQRAPQRRQEGRVDRVEQRTGYGRGAGGLGGRIRARARGQGLHKLDMKRRRLRAERLIGLAVRPKSRRDGHRHLIGARGQHRRRVGRGRGVGRPDRRTDACQIRGRCRDGLRRRDHKRYVTPPKRSWPNKPGQPGRDAQVFQRLMDRSALHRPTGSEIPGFPALLTDPWVFGSAR